MKKIKTKVSGKGLKALWVTDSTHKKIMRMALSSDIKVEDVILKLIDICQKQK
jgi:hypothetical protein